MRQLRRSEDRGLGERGWLDSWHSFSFSDYDDPAWRGFGPLRVLNEDRIVPSAGFPPHGHRDMEILTYVLSGTLRHRDSTGGDRLLRHGELQLMRAGRGIVHSEMNASHSEPVHLLQIWIEPDARGLEPGYQQEALDAAALRTGFRTVVAPHEAAFTIAQDAQLRLAWPDRGQDLEEPLDPARRYYLHVARGEIVTEGTPLRAGDALLLQRETSLALRAAADAELLLFDLP